MKPMFDDLTDDELSKELKDYAEHRSGEISDLTRAASIRIAVLSARVRGTEEIEQKCHTCKHYTKGEYDGSCGSYICKEYSGWEDKTE